MMVKNPRRELVQVTLSFVEQGVAARARSRLRSNDIEHAGGSFPCLLLFFRRLAADRERSRIIRMVTSESDAKVQNHELACPNLPIARRAAAGIRAEVLSKVCR